MRNVAILATGGVDSTVLLYQSVEKGILPHVLTVDYGQAVFGIQKKLLEKHCNLLQLQLTVLTIVLEDWQKKHPGLFTPAFIPAEEQSDPQYDKLGHAEYFVEGRNLIMVGYAMAWCSAHCFDELQIGFLYNQDAWKHRRSYRIMTADISPHFLDAMNILSLTGFSHQLRLRAPFFENYADKSFIVAEGKRLKIDMLNDTYSCYFTPPCQRCNNCLDRKKYLGDY